MPGTFEEFFDARALDEQQRGSIEFVLNSPAYQEYFKPFMEAMLRSLNHKWKDRSQARKDQYPDEFLAGGVVYGEALLKFFDVIIAETRMERIHGAMENMTPEMLYELRRQRGEIKTVTGAGQKAEPSAYDPAEDF